MSTESLDSKPSETTIAAIASGLVQSGIGVIRISGPEAFLVADRVFSGPGGPLSAAPARSIRYGHVRQAGEVIDEVLAMLMRAPHSYTGEDVVELQCHGGPFVMKRLLQAVLAAGAEPAEPGEFTKRAFLNGRLDLSQAEAVMDLIDAQSDLARRASLDALGGSMSRRIRQIRAQLLEDLAFIEAALDDPEHLSADEFVRTMRPRVESMTEELTRLIETADEGRIFREGIRTVILGLPNVGKSSLLNLLLDEERAIVTQTPGTTRDVLEESVRVGDVLLRLVDTAGIRNASDEAERIGVERAEQKAAEADLILYVIDATKPYDAAERDRMLPLLAGRRAIVLLNKTDLPAVLDKDAIARETGCQTILFSAKEGTGREELTAAITGLFETGALHQGEALAVANARQRTSLSRARESLRLLLGSIDAGLPEDLYGVDMMDAYTELGRILGEAVGEDLVDEIFAKFCLGK